MHRPVIESERISTKGISLKENAMPRATTTHYLAKMSQAFFSIPLHFTCNCIVIVRRLVPVGIRLSDC